MHANTQEPPYLKLFLAGAWTLAAIVVTTALLGFTNVIDQHFILAAVVLCGPPAFVLMLLADKVAA